MPIILTGCVTAPTVIYKSNPPGAIITGPAHGGGNFSHRTPFSIYYPSLTSDFKEGICSKVVTPTVRWDDGVVLNPFEICLIHRRSELLFTKPVLQHIDKPKTQSMPVVTIDLNVAKEKCLELGFKKDTEKFGDCVLKISK